MDRRHVNYALGLTSHPGKFLKNPPAHAFPNTSKGWTVHMTIVHGQPQVVASPPNANAMGPTYSPQPSPPTNAPTNVPTNVPTLGPTSNPQPLPAGPDEKIPLATLAELHDLLLVRNRKGGKTEDGDTYMVRKVARSHRLPPDPPTPEKLMTFLEQLEECGMPHEAARRARLGINPINALKKEVPEFKALFDQAIERFKEKIEMEAYRRGVNGWDEPVFGGQGKDRVVGTIKRYDSRLMELMLKKNIPEYREKFEGTVNVTGGVLMVPTTALNKEEWLKQHGGEKLPARELIDEPRQLGSPPPDSLGVQNGQDSAAQ